MLEKKISLFTNNKGNEFLTQLEATLELSDKLDSVVEAVKSIPQTVIPETVIPEQKEVVFPDVQKVELINPPKEKDDTEVKNLLKDLVAEVKKKEEYAYDIEIDATLKAQLKGDKGEAGTNGKDGKDALPTDIVAELESLEGDARLDVSAVKGTEELIDEIATKIAKREVKKVKPSTTMMYGGGSTTSSGSGSSTFTGLTDVPSSYVGQGTKFVRVNAGETALEFTTVSGGGAVDSVNGETGVVVLDTGDVADTSDKRYVTDADLVTLSNTYNTNTGDQLMYGTIAVAGQGDLDPTGTGDTLTVVAGNHMEVLTDPMTNELTFNNTATQADSFGIVVDGAGTAITTGSKGTRYIPFDCTVTGWDIRGDVSGSCVFDVKRSGTSLAGSEKPTLSGTTSNSDVSLSTWTTSLTAGDVIEFVVDSAATLTRATVTILVTKV